MSQLYDAAMSYAERGWFVLPLHTLDKHGRCTCGSPCRTPGKHPRIQHGLLNASNDPDQITTWWTQWPDANIGVRTGRASNLWVLDIDSGKSLVGPDGVIYPQGEQTLHQLEIQAGQRIPDTLTNMTGSGGRHLLFEYPEGEETYRNRVNVAPSIDVRGENGYIVVPPSMHISGRRYMWADEDEPIAPAPMWLMNLQGVDDKPFETKEEVPEGGRNDYLFRYAARLVGEGRGDDEVATLVIGTNQRVCKPPLTDYEVMIIINSALRYDANPEEAVLVFDDEPSEVPVMQDGEYTALSIAELFSNPPEPTRPLVSDGILDEGNGLILAGVSNVGKSWLAMDLAVALATGGQWLGHFKCEPSRVLYIDEESSLSSDYDRFKMIFNAHLMPDDVVAGSTEMPLFLAVQRGIKLDTPKGHTILARMLSQYRPDVVIFDALVRMHSGDENSTKDMSSFFDRANQLRAAYGCAMVFLHHVRKPAKDDPGDDADQMRGNSDIRGWPDTILMAKENEAKDGILITHAKSRDHRKLDRFEIGRVIDDGEAAFKYRKDVMAKPVTPEQKRRAIMDIIQKTRGRVTVSTLAMEMGISVDTVKAHLEPMLDTGMISEVSARGERWYVANDGMGQLPYEQ